MTESNGSRRDFLRNVLFGAAAFSSGLRLDAQDKPEKDNGRKLGVALLGLGRYSSGQLGPALRETKVCDTIY